MRTLREGDHDAFVGYFSLFRTPVYHFAWRLLRDDAAAAGATRDALTAAFRCAILDDAIDDLETLTFRCALEACEARPEPTTEMLAAGSPTPQVRRRGGSPSESAAQQRFAAAFESLERRHSAALLLHDLQGMDSARSAAVLGLSTEAAGALLFRAREEFREALHERPGYVDGRKCRQAEEALAGAVGLGMDQDGLTRLRRHAGYCRPCRRFMKSWTAANVGLAAVLAPPPPPEALAAAPVFGDIVDGVMVRPRRAPRALWLPLARTGRALRGRTAAWVVAAACLALAGGLVVHGLGLRPVVLMQSVGPAIRLITAPPADGSEPAAARGKGQGTTTTTAPAIGISGGSEPGSAAATSSGPAQPAGPADEAASSGDTPSDQEAPEAAAPDQNASPPAFDSQAGGEPAGGEPAGDERVAGDRTDDDSEAAADRKAGRVKAGSGDKRERDGHERGRDSGDKRGRDSGDKHGRDSADKHGRDSADKHGRSSADKHGRVSDKRHNGEGDGHGRSRDSGQKHDRDSGKRPERDSGTKHDGRGTKHDGDSGTKHDGRSTKHDRDAGAKHDSGNKHDRDGKKGG